VRSWWFHHHGSRPQYWTSLSDPVRTMSTEKGKQRYNSIVQAQQRRARGREGEEKEKRLESVAQSWPAAAGTSGCSRELQNNPTPWIMARWWRKWRRWGGWWGLQPWGISIARRQCGWYKSNWRARWWQTTEKEEGLTKNGSRRRRSSTKA